MDRTPEQGPQLKPAFDRGKDIDRPRQEEIQVKSDRLLDKAWTAYQDQKEREYPEQLKQTYTMEEVKALEKPEHSPEWGKSAPPIVGAPKSPVHAEELAAMKHEKILNKHTQWISKARDSMIANGRPVGNGIIAGTKRGGEHRKP